MTVPLHVHYSRRSAVCCLAPLFGECVDCDTLRRLEQILGRLMEAVRGERADAPAVTLDTCHRE
jgi:hypothetical protein